MPNIILHQDKFIQKAHIKHNYKYDYSHVIYKPHNAKVCIICPLHGEFYQTPSNHLHGSGCKECGRLRLVALNSSNINNFIQSAINKHGDTYDYSNVIYTSARSKISIICKKHGEFIQSAHHHLAGTGCPLCKSTSVSKWERTVQAHIKKKYPDAIFNDKYTIDKNVELDIYIPSLNVAIECQGDYWHMNPKKYSESSINKTMKMTAKQVWERDSKKHELIRCVGITLILLWEYDWKIATRTDKINGSTNCTEFLLKIPSEHINSDLSSDEWHNIIERYNIDKLAYGIKRIMYNNGKVQIRIATGSEIPNGFIRGCLPESDEHKKRRKNIRDMKKYQNIN